MIWFLIFMPAVAGLLAFVIRSDAVRRTLLVAVAVAHTGTTLAAWRVGAAEAMNGWLLLDPAGLLFLTVTSVLFLAAAVYGVGYLAREAELKGPAPRRDFEEGSLFVNAPEAIFTACLLLFLATMTLVTVSQHLGLLWVAVEATTLASSPLIYFHRHHRSLEATWKYLLICSVGIALALLGNFFLAAAAAGNPTPGGVPASGQHVPALVSALAADGPRLNPTWLKVAFVFLLVGYGTKMGLAPLHTWLPDAHSEAPSVVSALLSGALLNCAFLAVLRVFGICVAAGLGPFCQQLLIALGLLSMAAAAVFIVGQADFKRMLAYSSVEHMGILAVGVGLGGLAGFGAMLHAVNHSLTKAMLFLVAGNILAAYKTKSTADVRGVIRVLPISGMLWLAGFLAITGSPPFGAFLSEYTILAGAVKQGRPWIAAAMLALLAVIFVGFASIVLRMAQGEPLPTPNELRRPVGGDRLLAVVPPAVLAGLTLVLGVYVPPALTQLLDAAARSLSIGGL